MKWKHKNLFQKIQHPTFKPQSLLIFKIYQATDYSRLKFSDVKGKKMLVVPKIFFTSYIRWCQRPNITFIFQFHAFVAWQNRLNFPLALSNHVNPIRHGFFWWLFVGEWGHASPPFQVSKLSISFLSGKVFFRGASICWESTMKQVLQEGLYKRPPPKHTSPRAQ